MENIIEIEKLRRVYSLRDDKVVALKNINISIKKGEVCCILGTSGSGKSTLLNMMAGIEPPSHGSIKIMGQDIVKFSEKKMTKFRQENVGFVFQSYNLMNDISALDNVAMPLVFKGISKNTRQKAAKQMLAAVGLGDRMLHKPKEMSGGQQQRVGIARAFVAKPRIVFADEPTGNLDSKTKDLVMRLILNMAAAQDQTLIIVTHDPNIAKYCHRIITLVDGDIVSDEINKNPQTLEGEALELSVQ